MMHVVITTCRQSACDACGHHDMQAVGMTCDASGQHEIKRQAVQA